MRYIRHLPKRDKDRRKHIRAQKRIDDTGRSNLSGPDDKHPTKPEEVKLTVPEENGVKVDVLDSWERRC
jgi:hypothetical protein